MGSRTGFLITTILVFLLSAQETQNLIKNGDFSDSLTYVWNFNSNGADATGKIEPLGRFFIDISTPGPSDNAPQLQQGNITLEKNEAYILRFKAYSTEPVVIRAQLEGNGIVYSDTSAGTVALTESPKTYNVPFFMKHNSDYDVQLQFNCGISRQKARIAFNDIVLEKDTATRIIISKPEVDEVWNVGIEKKIKWITVGSLNNVIIKYTNTNGESWKTITEKVANDNEYTWIIPQEATGDKCQIMVSSTDGKISDISPEFTISSSETPIVTDSGNVIKNGDFSDSTDWVFDVFEGSASGKIVDGEYVIEIESLSNTDRENSYKVKLSQPSIALEEECMYHFSFDAYASQERAIYANIGESGGAYSTVSGGDTIPVNLTTEKKTFSYSFIAKDVSNGPDYRIEFNCATGTGKIYIDNVSLVKTDISEFFVIKPFTNSVLKAGSSVQIEWKSSDAETVTLQYSGDKGNNWELIEDSVGNLYSYQWTVPNVTSTECMLRVIDTESDSVLGTSAVFQINSFGIPVKNGEQIVNGHFDNEMTGWNTLAMQNGAEASAFVREKTLKISIDEAGDSLSDIIISQDNLTLLEGVEYYLSFDGYSAGVRNLQLAVKSMENDSIVLFDTTVSLPQVSSFFEWTFTPQFDVFARIEFRMGGSSALVSLDNVSLNTEHVSVRKIARKSSVDLMTMRIIHAGPNVSFLLNEKVNGILNIYNLSGKLVRSISASSSNILWDRKDAYGNISARGSYIAALRADKKKMVHSFLIK